MTHWKDRVALFAAALWWGSLTSIGFLVVPMLFVWLPTPALAGNMAGHLFAAQTWVTLGCGLLLLVHIRSATDDTVGRSAQVSLMLVAAGVLLALLQQYGVSPRIIARENLRLWHAVGSGMYLAQWVCASVLLWRKAPTGYSCQCSATQRAGRM